MTDALAAHMRLLERLRDRITTHELEQTSKPRGMKYTKDEKELLKRRLQRCFDTGMNRKEAAKLCGCTNKTLVRMFGKIRFVDTRRKRDR